jgi:hypothetical protein
MGNPVKMAATIGVMSGVSPESLERPQRVYSVEKLHF